MYISSSSHSIFVQFLSMRYRVFSDTFILDILSQDTGEINKYLAFFMKVVKIALDQLLIYFMALYHVTRCRDAGCKWVHLADSRYL